MPTVLVEEKLAGGTVLDPVHAWFVEGSMKVALGWRAVVGVEVVQAGHLHAVGEQAAAPQVVADVVEL